MRWYFVPIRGEPVDGTFTYCPTTNITDYNTTTHDAEFEYCPTDQNQFMTLPVLPEFDYCLTDQNQFMTLPVLPEFDYCATSIVEFSPP